MQTILFIHHSSSHGGAGISMVKAIQALSDQYKIAVAYPAGWPVPESLKAIGIQLLVYESIPALFPLYSGGSGFLSLGALQFIQKKNRFRAELMALVEEVKPNIVLVNSITLSYLGRSIGSDSIKYGCFVRETVDAHAVFVRRIYKHFLNKYDHVFFISKYDQKVFSALNTDTSVVRNTYDVSLYDEQQDGVVTKNNYGEPLKILYLGGDSYIKGYFNLLKVGKRLFSDEQKLDKRRFVFTICGHMGNGNFTYMSKIKSFLKSLYAKSIFPNVDDAIQNGFFNVIGEVDSLANQYLNSDVVFLPIVKPHQQRAVFEAGVFYKPVIVPRFECLLEGVSDGVTGIFFDSKDSCSAIEAFDSLVCNRGLIEKMGFAGRHKAELNHSFEVYKKNLLAAIDRVLLDVNSDS